MKAARESGEASYDPERKEDPIVALDKALKCVEVSIEADCWLESR